MCRQTTHFFYQWVKDFFAFILVDEGFAWKEVEGRDIDVHNGRNVFRLL